MFEQVLSPLSVFLAGMVMFLAPCTFPLLPAFLGFLSGVTEKEIAAGVQSGRVRWLVFRSALLFVLGFGTVLVLLGVLAGLLGTLVGPFKSVLRVLSGLLIIVFGVSLTGVLNVPWLLRERRFRMPASLMVRGSVSAYLMGAAFAFGWTPCIGPILATVLLHASSLGTMLAGVVELAIFAAGYGVPFLVLALAVSQASRFADTIASYLRPISVLGGVLVILFGLLLLLGDLPVVNRALYSFSSSLDYEQALMRYQ